MAHAAIKSLPDDVLTKIDLALVKNKSCAALAKALHTDGYLKHVSEESLARELRKYRQSEITEKAAARAQSIARSPNPAMQKRILEKAQDYDVIANWLKLIQRQEKRVDKWLNAGAGNLPSTAVLNDIKTLGDLYQKFNVACMDRGLLPRAATNVNLRAEMVVVDASNVDVVIQALLQYMEQSPDVHPFAREAVENAQVRRTRDEMLRIAKMPTAEFEEHRALIEGEAVRVD